MSSWHSNSFEHVNSTSSSSGEIFFWQSILVWDADFSAWIAPTNWYVPDLVRKKVEDLPGSSDLDLSSSSQSSAPAQLSTSPAQVDKNSLFANSCHFLVASGTNRFDKAWYPPNLPAREATPPEMSPTALSPLIHVS